jgi:hypothetical protein
MLLTPCRLLITELKAPHGTRRGRIQFFDLNGAALYDHEWVIDD